jgi:DNA-binding transcriptional ArsR family regulator
MLFNFNQICTYRLIYKSLFLIKSMEEKYIMFSMDDDRIKYLSESLSNPSCKKILNILSEKELTETDIARELKIPLNTVDYNIKKLIKAGLIEKTSHFWSVRGKKMPVYKVSNKKIVISPKKSISLTSLIASALGTGILALGIRKFTQSPQEELMMVSEDFGPMALERTMEAAPELISIAFAPWQWFLLGAWLGIVLFFTFTIINERRNKNESK